MKTNEKSINYELLESLFEELNEKVDTNNIEFADASCGCSGVSGCNICTGGKW